MTVRHLIFVLFVALSGFTGCKGKSETVKQSQPVTAEANRHQYRDFDPKAGGRFCCEAGQTLAGGTPPKYASLWCELDGVKQGPVRTFHPEGLLHFDTRYEQGLEVGTRIGWHKNGLKHYEMGYQAGQLHGPWTEWSDAAGQIHGQGSYEKGRKDGAEVIYHKNGNKKSVGTYREGRRHGLWTEWRSSGKKKSVVEYRDGVRDGLETFWHENGRMWYQEHYENGTRAGSREEWTPEGLPLTGPKTSEDPVARGG